MGEAFQGGRSDCSCAYEICSDLLNRFRGFCGSNPCISVGFLDDHTSARFGSYQFLKVVSGGRAPGKSSSFASSQLLVIEIVHCFRAVLLEKKQFLVSRRFLKLIFVHFFKGANAGCCLLAAACLLLLACCCLPAACLLLACCLPAACCCCCLLLLAVFFIFEMKKGCGGAGSSELHVVVNDGPGSCA